MVVQRRGTLEERTALTPGPFWSKTYVSVSVQLLKQLDEHRQHALFPRLTTGRMDLSYGKSDGTAAGTVMVKDINSGPTSATPSELTNVNGTLFFIADDGSMATNYGRATAQPQAGVVKDIRHHRPASLSDQCQRNSCISSTNDGASGYELWKSDGTTAARSSSKTL